MKKNIVCGCLLCLFFVQVPAADKAGAKKQKRPAPTVIESCVSGDTLSFRNGDSGTLLDEIDRFQVATEIIQRYPMIERDGLYPTAIALWRRKEGDWVFATLMARAEPPHPWCFTANVAIGEIGVAPALLKKYFGIAPAPI